MTAERDEPEESSRGIRLDAFFGDGMIMSSGWCARDSAPTICMEGSDSLNFERVYEQIREKAPSSRKIVVANFSRVTNTGYDFWNL